MKDKYLGVADNPWTVLGRVLIHPGESICKHPNLEL